MKVLKKSKDKIREKVQDFFKKIYNFLIISDLSKNKGRGTPRPLNTNTNANKPLLKINQLEIQSLETFSSSDSKPFPRISLASTTVMKA